MADSEAKLSRVAAQQYTEKKFGPCAKTMQRVLALSKAKSAASLLLRHNFAVANFCAESQRDPEKLLGVLLKMAPTWDYEKEKLSEERCVVVYNIALLEVGMRRYRTALTRLEPVFAGIEEFSDYLSVKVCFLLLDIYLVLGRQHCSTIQNATPVISFLQSFANQTTAKKAPTSAKVAPEAATPGEEAMQVDMAEFKYQFHLYKAKFSLFNRVLNQATREIKVCMGISNASPQPMFLKSNLEHLKENYDKAIKILNALQDDKSDPSLSTLYFNNIGVIHFQLRKYEAAGFYFARAMAENETAHCSEGQWQVELGTFTRDRRQEILYNAGLLHLVAGRPELAFNCFQGSALTYYKDPRLWLRMAECCVATYAKQATEARGAQRTVSPVHIPSSAIPGSDAVTTKLVLHGDPDSALEISEKDEPQLKSLFSGAPFGKLSLEYAETCLRSCLYLCRRLLSKDGTASVR